jgi:hypothetical protein
MPIFNNATLTELAQGFTAADSSLTTNYKGSAPIDKTITQDSWLPGTKGLDCKLVHGDRWQELKGNLTENIASSAITNVGGKAGAAIDSSPVTGSWTISIAGNEDITVYGNLNQEVYGESNYLFVDTTDSTHVQTVNFDYQSPMNAFQPTQHFQAITWTGIATLFQLTLAASIVQAFGVQLSGGIVYNLSAALINHQVGIICPTNAVIDDDAHLSKADLEVINNKIGALDNTTDLLICNVVALDLHAGAILGANQIL